MLSVSLIHRQGDGAPAHQVQKILFGLKPFFYIPFFFLNAPLPVKPAAAQPDQPVGETSLFG
jgi:hypothetical protein